MQGISIVIPALNESNNLAETLTRTQSDPPAEVIVVDGGSSDGTPQIAEWHGAAVLHSARGRARQMNLGARAAAGEILLFLHADTLLPEGFDRHVRLSLQRPDTAAGAFRLKISGCGRGLRFIEGMANFRSRYLHLPYGDQAIFLKASLFRDLGGFPELPIMEDYELMRRIRRRGRIAIAPACVITAGRRWERIGVWRTTWRNQLMILGYWAGISPERLARWYRR